MGWGRAGMIQVGRKFELWTGGCITYSKMKPKTKNWKNHWLRRMDTIQADSDKGSYYFPYPT